MTKEVVKRKLGKTNLEVTPIGLGAMQFSGGRRMFRFILSAVPSETMDEVVKVGIDSGINWIDTAELYGSGASEKAVSHALTAAGKTNGDILITTKWMPFLKTAKSIIKSAKKSASYLDPYPIDLYLVHRPAIRASIKAQMNAMADLVDMGKIRAVGISNFSKEKMIQAHDALSDRNVPLATNQVRFNLLDRRIETNGILETAKELDVTITAYTPLGMGLLAGHLHSNPELLKKIPIFRRRRLRGKLKKTQALIDTLEAIALKHKVTVAQITLSWTINFHGDTIVAIPGASKPYQSEQNAGAMHVALSSEEMETLSALSFELSG